MQYELGQANRLGNRASNQDRFDIIEDETGVLLVLADGMGGRPGGAVAAQTVVDWAKRVYKDIRKPVTDPQKMFTEILHKAHLAIVQIGQQQEPPVIPGTTGLLCLVQEGRMYSAHVGDSRIYVFRDGVSVYRTTDHSYVEELYKNGEISRAEQEDHPQKSHITQCVGCLPKVPEIEHASPRNLKPNDIVLLCSDGLWGPLDDAQIGAMLGGGNLDEAINAIAEKSEHTSYPRSDNITAASLRFISADELSANTDNTRTRKPATADEADKLESAISEIEKAIQFYSSEMKTGDSDDNKK